MSLFLKVLLLNLSLNVSLKDCITNERFLFISQHLKKKNSFLFLSPTFYNIISCHKRDVYEKVTCLSKSINGDNLTSNFSMGSKLLQKINVKHTSISNKWSSICNCCCFTVPSSSLFRSKRVLPSSAASWRSAT